MDKTEADLDFGDAVELFMAVHGCTREQAIEKLKQAMASGELPFYTPDSTGEYKLADPREIALMDDDGWLQGFLQ